MYSLHDSTPRGYQLEKTSFLSPQGIAKMFVFYIFNEKRRELNIESLLWEEIMVFQSERLNFRPIDQEDMNALFNVWGNSETMRFCGGVITKERIHQIIEHNSSQYNTYGNTVFAVIKNEKFLGTCGGKLDEDDPFHVEIIIHLAKEYQNQGYGTEALKAYIAWLKATKMATYIYASVHPDNQASLNMVKKCGLVQCGFRQYEDTGFVNEPYFELNLD